MIDWQPGGLISLVFGRAHIRSVAFRPILTNGLALSSSPLSFSVQREVDGVL